MTPETPRAQCRCGHSQMMHPFGLSENLAYTGTCMVCDCKEFDKVETPSIKKRPSAHWDHVERVAERQAETPRATQDVETEDVVALAKGLLEQITPGPWAWEPIAEKSNEWAVGQAFYEDGTPISGRIPEDEWVEEKVIERRLVGMNESGHANFKDAEFIAAAPRLVSELSAELSSLRSKVETLRMYTRHTPDCELEWPVARRQKSPEFGRYLMKRVNGKIAHGWYHQCGAAGFGLGADDVCYGCDRESEEREPDCTCGLSAALGKDSQ